MVFSSVPLYLDPPNWQQHPNQQHLHQGSGGSSANDQNHQHQLLLSHPMPPPQMGGIHGPGGPQIRPNSMAERARLAKIPPPEAPLKCPRCESTNTKFCYFNNYSLTQPRHFCKTCRRYWTRGGALRNVPVGGGCRRNKRSSSKSNSGGGGGGGGGSSMKSPLPSPIGVSGDGHQDMVATIGSGGGGPPPIPGLHSGSGIGGGMTSLMASLQNMSQLGMGNLGFTFGGGLHTPPPHHHMGGGMGGLASMEHQQQQQPMEFSEGGGNTNNNNMLQFPQFEMGGGSSALYSASFQNNSSHDQQGVEEDEEEINVNMGKSSSSSMMSSLSGSQVKMEGVGGRGVNLEKQLMMGMSWGGAMNHNHNIPNTTGPTTMWTDLSGLNSSSSSHLL